MSCACGHVWSDVRSINSLNIIGAGERHVQAEVHHVHYGCYVCSKKSKVHAHVRRIVQPQLRNHLIQNKWAVVLRVAHEEGLRWDAGDVERHFRRNSWVLYAESSRVQVRGYYSLVVRINRVRVRKRQILHRKDCETDVVHYRRAHTHCAGS